MFNSKVFLAEFIGTFALTFVGVAAGMSGAGLLAVALAHGFTLAVFAYAYGHISGTHVNPAVTFALALNGTVKWGEAFFYWIAQFTGAIIAAFLLYLFVGDISGGATIGSLTDSAPVFAMLVEAILTFFLVNTIRIPRWLAMAGSLPDGRSVRPWLWRYWLAVHLQEHP